MAKKKNSLVFNDNILLFGGLIIIIFALITSLRIKSKADNTITEMSNEPAGTSMMAEEEMEMMITEGETITLEDVSDGESSGEASILRKNGKLLHTVTAQLPEPPEGFVYEGWLVKPAPMLDFFSTGVMTMELEGEYSLVYSAEMEYPEYNRVVITLESVVDETPEDHILEGSFTN